MSYGETGKKYFIGGNPIAIDDKFLMSTIMALVMVLKENLPELSQQEVDLFDLVEFLASRIYETITENEPDNAGETTSEPQV
jgi:hypothetical protein